MNWMVRWAGPFPLFVETAEGAQFRYVDGHEYVDFCLGDTGRDGRPRRRAPTIAAVERQLRRGITHMLPTEDAIGAGEELRRRFGLPLLAVHAHRRPTRTGSRSGSPARSPADRRSSSTTTATTARSTRRSRGSTPTAGSVPRRGHDRAAGRRRRDDPGRAVQRHRRARAGARRRRRRGRADRAGADERRDRAARARATTTRVRELTRRTGTLLIIDETHTICAGPGGATRPRGLEPDMLVIGKTIGGGIPVGDVRVHGRGRRPDPRASSARGRGRRRRRRDAGRLRAVDGGDPGDPRRGPDRRGVRPDDPARASAGPPASTRSFATRGVPWHVTRLGRPRRVPLHARRRRATAPSSGPTATRARAFLHLWAMNRGMLMTPFHNMALMSPATTEADVDRHTEVFAEAVDALFA